ncbi:MAG: AAA family ATPase [Cyanobacteria bacterium]|jgi:chromosome partitioning protein|nr:AAA family ATPase [Cyanobacteria bacterium GSL.Bin21]
MIITITAYKGGVGKTTTSVHLAGCLSDQGKTLLIDGDANRSILQWNESGFFPFAVADLDNADLEGYDYVVIDTAAHPSLDDLVTLSANSDLMIIPSTPDALALGTTVQVINDLPDVAYKVLLTIVPPRPSKAGKEAKKSLQKADIPTFKTEIPRLVAYQKAALAEKLVRDAKSTGWQTANRAYKDLAKEVLNEL